MEEPHHEIHEGKINWENTKDPVKGRLDVRKPRENHSEQNQKNPHPQKDWEYALSSFEKKKKPWKQHTL